MHLPPWATRVLDPKPGLALDLGIATRSDFPVSSADMDVQTLHFEGWRARAMPRAESVSARPSSVNEVVCEKKERLYANPEGQSWPVYLVCLLPFPVSSSARRIGAKEDIDHDLKHARRGDTGRGATARGAIGATILHSKGRRAISKKARWSEERIFATCTPSTPGDTTLAHEAQWVLRRNSKLGEETYANPE